MLSTVAIANYRSLRNLTLPLGPITVITGPNGSGKSSVYRALRLLAEVAQGGVVRSLALEGGLTSTLWAGPETIATSVLRGDFPVQGTRRRGPQALRLGFCSDGEEDFGYAIDIGMNGSDISGPEAGGAFSLDPEIKHEVIWNGPDLRPASMLVERKGAALRGRDDSGRWQPMGKAIPEWASMLTEFVDPRTAPEMLTLREQIRKWRFYDHFRTDAASAARQPQLGTRTTVLHHDGVDLAAAIQTILQIGDHDALHAAIDDAFPGARLRVEWGDGRFSLLMHQHGLLRPLAAAELSDGTLRFILWSAALLSPRPPPLLVLNEPETSLHQDLLPALGRLIVRAARDTQVIVVSHANRLIASLEEAAISGALSFIQLEKRFGETQVGNMDRSDLPLWRWPTR